MFRVEANTGLTSDPVYIFSIDGVKFEDFMTRQEAQKLPKQEEPAKRPSVTTAKPAAATRAGSFTADKPVTATKAATVVVTKSSTFDLLDASDNTPAADPFTASSSSADPFAPSPAAKPSPDPFAPSSDPFAPAPAPAPTASDPFAPVNKSSGLSGFESSGSTNDPFFSGEATHKKPFAPPAGSQATFATQASNSAPARRQSAIEIMGDFAGLTVTAPPPQPASVMLPEPSNNSMNMSDPSEQIKAQKAAPTDPWASLVDLDLNKKPASEQHAQRRASINSGPALSSMKGNDAAAANNRRGSMPSMASGEFSGNSNPFAPPAAPPQQYGGMGGGDPFAAASPQPFQGQQPYGMGGAGVGGNPFGGGPSGGMGAPQGYGGGMGAPQGYGGGMSNGGMAGFGGPSGMGGYQTQKQQPAKRSSLDTMDPFKM